MNRRTAAGRRLLAVCLAFLLAAAVTLSAGCTRTKHEPIEINSLERVEIESGPDKWTCDFADNTFAWELYDPAAHSSCVFGETTLSDSDAADYKALLTTVCREMADEPEAYSGRPPFGALVGNFWKLRFLCDGGKEYNVTVTSYAERFYPESWYDFVLRTEELAGYDMNDYVLSEPQEVAGLKYVVLYLRNGSIYLDFSGTDDVLEVGLYGTEDEMTSMRFPHSGLGHLESLLTRICDDMVLHEDAYTGGEDGEDNVKPDKLQRIVFSYRGGSGDIAFTGNESRLYPYKWDEFVRLFTDAAGYDISELMAADVVNPFNIGVTWEAAEVLCDAAQPVRPDVPLSGSTYIFLDGGSAFVCSAEDGASEPIDYEGERVTLTEENFDDLFGKNKSLAADIRENAQRAWRFDVEGIGDGAFYVLIVTESGEVYIACGTNGGECGLARLESSGIS